MLNFVIQMQSISHVGVRGVLSVLPWSRLLPLNHWHHPDRNHLHRYHLSRQGSEAMGRHLFAMSLTRSTP